MRVGSSVASAVHPRVCGEASAPAVHLLRAQGPSPRVRGSLAFLPQDILPARSIPACAGKPTCIGRPSGKSPVHPRVCGEAPEPGRRLDGRGGPSPRVRGSRDGPGGRHRWPGSIPACAGKPPDPSRRSRRRRVHPRVCGEAGFKGTVSIAAGGPSPRVRGSHLQLGDAGGSPGSIPACAGKPSWRWTPPPPRGVHPRVCGEALVVITDWSAGKGPSPRVRGSRGPARRAGHLAGSIPACAGKPEEYARRQAGTAVHPRVCGEAWDTFRQRMSRQGPSPRVRGSPQPRMRVSKSSGSIPACAGKPPSG